MTPARAFVAQTVRRMLAHGKPRAQAVAIALNMARRRGFVVGEDVGFGAGNFWYVIGYRGKRGAPGAWGKPVWTDFSSVLALMPPGAALLQWAGSGWQVLKP